MRHLHLAALAAALAFTLPALAGDTAAKAPKASYTTKDIRTVQATVTAIDQSTRRVTLKGPDGKSQELVVGPEARNLAQVEVGDQVIVEYREALAIDVTETDPSKPLPPPSETMASDRAAPGAKPGGVVARTVLLSGTVQAIDLNKKTAVIKGSGGNTVQARIEHPERWTKVKVGDTITLRYSEALALSVKPVGPKKPAGTDAVTPAK
jgi:hypothetical protein